MIQDLNHKVSQISKFPDICVILASRYSSIPYLEPSLPRPDCLTPPNGATYIEENLIISWSITNFSLFSIGKCKERLTSVEISPSLTPTSPYSRASETRQERCRFVVNTYAANPAYAYRKRRTDKVSHIFSKRIK